MKIYQYFETQTELLSNLLTSTCKILTLLNHNYVWLNIVQTDQNLDWALCQIDMQSRSKNHWLCLAWDTKASTGWTKPKEFTNKQSLGCPNKSFWSAPWSNFHVWKFGLQLGSFHDLGRDFRLIWESNAH